MKVEYVTEVKPRKSEWPERLIILPPLVPQPKDIFSKEYMAWYEENANCSVKLSDFALAKELEQKVWLAYNDKNQDELKNLLRELRKLLVAPFEERSPQEKWAHMMVQLPDDIGGPNKDKISEALSARCQGRVLEAMCGFNSYLDPSSNRDVIALDYCREALERYQYPTRTRILFDLNQIDEKIGIEFFSAGEFNAITICFGFHYLHNPMLVFREFKRLLVVGGRLCLVENPNQCYRDIARRNFSTNNCSTTLYDAGFDQVIIEELPIAEEWELNAGGHYYLIEAFKG